MLLRSIFLGFLAAVACAATAANGMRQVVAPVDPPVYITNQSAGPVKVMWQTVWPHKALSPQREATVPAGAADLKARRGVIWYVHPGSGKAVENMLFVSIVDANGRQIAQKAADEAVTGPLAALEAKALHITVGAGLAIKLSTK